MDDENEIPLKEIASFSAVRFALKKISPFLPFMLTDAFLDVFIQSY